MTEAPPVQRPFYILSNKNNRFLINITNDSQELRITVENEGNIPKEMYEYYSENKNLPGIFKHYSINDIIIKLYHETNKLSILEEKDSLKLIYTGIVQSEKTIFEMKRKVKSVEEKLNELYDIVKYQKEKLDNIYGFQSVIITDNEKEKILEWLNEGSNRLLYLKLIYRRGNNMTMSYFHQKCDNIGPNLVICESINNEIFGGYTPFIYEGERNVHDRSSFIFSLSKNKKYPNKSSWKSNWIHKDFGPDFHWDFAFNLGTMSICRSFILKDQSKHNIDTGESCYLDDEPLFGNGYSNCEVKEIEVFQVMKYIPVPFNK